MGKSISHRQALEDAKQDHTGPVKGHGFEEREVGPFTINILYYSVEHKPEPDIGIEFTEYRATVYENGRKHAGLSFG